MCQVYKHCVRNPVLHVLDLKGVMILLTLLLVGYIYNEIICSLSCMFNLNKLPRRTTESNPPKCIAKARAERLQLSLTMRSHSQFVIKHTMIKITWFGKETFNPKKVWRGYAITHSGIDSAFCLFAFCHSHKFLTARVAAHRKN